MHKFNFPILSIINSKLIVFTDGFGDFVEKLPMYLKYLIVSFLVICFLLPGIKSIPPLDRDEARFSQASKQMLEDQNFVVIKFQDELRAKKPIGIYWVQSLSAYIFGKESITSYRIPNVIAFITLTLVFSAFVYNIAYRYFDVAFSSAINYSLLTSILLSIIFGFAIEIKQAKTDSILLMLCTIQQLIFWKIYNYGKESWNIYKHNDHAWLVRLFWFILALGILIKGPISPLLFFLTFISVVLLDRFVEKEWNLSWVRLFLWHQGLLIIFVITIPWVYLAWKATDGSLILNAIKGDFINKIKSGQENHWGPFGTYILLLFLTLWPIVLFVPYAARALFDWKHHRFIRFLISWILPFWFILELTPTKLPHYILPIYPGILLLVYLGMSSPPSGKDIYNKLSIVFRIFVFIFSIILGLAIIYFTFIFSSNIFNIFYAILFSVLILASITAGNTYFFNLSRQKLAPLYLMAILAGLSNIVFFSMIFPNLDRIHVTSKIESFIESFDIKPDTIVATGYHEPSLVFALGRDTLLLRPEETAIVLIEGDNTIAIVEEKAMQEVKKIMESFNREFLNLKSFSGYNLAKGEKVKINVIKPILNK